MSDLWGWGPAHMILAFASSKGGVGKSTTCAAVGAALALAGESVLMIDLDPNRTVERWSRKAKIPGLQVAAIPPAEFTSYLAEQSRGGEFDHVLVDLMGTREGTQLKAFARADLVIIPAQASEPDIREALVISGDVRAMSKEMGQDIPYRMLLTKMFPLRTRFADHAFDELERLKMPCFRTSLVERSAYREMFLSGEPPALGEKGKGAGKEIDDLLLEIRVIVARRHAEQDSVQLQEAG
jgi:chromosome partitioning protein